MSNVLEGTDILRTCVSIAESVVDVFFVQHERIRMLDCANSFTR